MRNQEILSFDKLPEAVLKLTEEVCEMKRLLRKESQEETIKIYRLNSDDIVPVFKEWGIKMSKSKLYKLTSKGLIPFSKIGNQLIFERDELLMWIEKQKIDPSKKVDESILQLSNSASKKFNSNTKKK